MDIAQLRNFQTIAELNHLTKAAEVLNISQPALSANLSRLENELGAPLFDRVGRRLYLNECGEIFKGYVERILLEVDNATAELSAYAHAESRILTVYSCTKTGNESRFLEFQRQYPDVFLRRIEISHRDIPSALKASDCDILLASFLRLEDVKTEYTLLTEEPVMAAMSRRHPLAKRESVSLQELRDEQFVVLPAGSSMRVLGDELLRKVGGFEPKVVQECYRCQLMYHISHNNCVVLVTRSSMTEICNLQGSDSVMSMVPINNENVSVKTVILWPNKKKTRTAMDFYKVLHAEP